MGNRPIATICVPVYKVEAYVAECIRSILRQDYPFLELIVVDDASPDSSMAIVKRIVAEENSRNHAVQLIELAENGGLNNARRHAVKAAQGKYLFFVDSDDYLTDTGAVTKVVAAMEQSGAPMAIFDFISGYKHRNKPFRHIDQLQGEEATAAFIDGSIPAYLWNKCFRKELFLPFTNYIGREITLWEDKNRVIPYSFLHQGICYVPGCFYHYRRYLPGAMSNNPSETALRSVQLVHQNMVEFFAQHPHGAQIDAALQREAVIVKLLQYRTDHYEAFRKASEDFPISRAEAGLLKGLTNAPYRLMVRFNNRGKLRAGFRVMRAVQRAKALL